ncbi:MAG: hypothetical protein A7315_02455 [Candidatus Altiarchaeales archaeon WOR_SM1_79]|nr:MAG: hypothetical protein A7315_02455 [Candidatus Altiarchaeales archaeon WOR_SM1_79]
MKRFENLFKPIKIGTVNIKNRIAMAPMNDFHQFFDGIEGTINQRCIDYYVERAKGEIGLIISMVFKTEEEITQYRDNGMLIWDIITKRSQERYAELAKYVHSYGTKIFFQLSAGPGRVAKGEIIDAGFVPVSASDNKAFFRPNVTCRALSIGEVEKIAESFGKAAEIISNAGIDGIEVHGHEGYLIDQFTTALWNRRKDKYGGDLQGRLTFPIEILKAIREKAGEDYPVIYRYGSKHFITDPWKSTTRLDDKEIGRDIDESIEMAKILEKAGYNCLHTDVGCYESAYWAHPPIYLPHGFSVDLTWKIKKAVNIPVIAVGRLGIPKIADKVLEEGKADIIAIGRDLLADPHWARKVKEGRLEDIRPCIGCHEGMYRTEVTGQYLTCALNPFCGNETSFSIKVTKESKKILIAGGGIAGMEAARIAQMRGHDVLLFEKTGNLGGQLIPASKPDFKGDIKRLLEYYQKQINKSKINIKFNTTVTPALIHKVNPDIVIVATGANPIIPKIGGIGRTNIVTCIDIYMGKKETGNDVIIVGGGLEGCELALMLAKDGKKVTIIEMLPKLEPDIHRANKAMLLDLLDENGVEVLTGTKVQEIIYDGVIVTDNDLNKRNVKADTVVIAVGMKPDKYLYNSLIGEPILTYEIGDCKDPRKILDAVWEANMVAATI